jgi:hypothetical protein
LESIQAKVVLIQAKVVAVQAKVVLIQAKVGSSNSAGVSLALSLKRPRLFYIYPSVSDL